MTDRMKNRRDIVAPLLLALTMIAGLAPTARAQTVFATGFEAGLPAAFVAPGSQIEGVQGCAGLGAPGNQFSGSLLRYNAQTLHETSLSLTDLPPHTHVSLGFLLAVIDSWDGTELLEVVVDGDERFSHWFQLATGDDSSYVPPVGGLLSAGGNLGWSAGSWYGRDRAYDLSLEPAFMDIPHTASTLTVVWRLDAVSGGAAAQWQGGADESWGLDNVTVAVSSGATGAPPAAAGFALGGNAPNPFNPSTRIFYELPADGADVSLRVYDLGGHLVRTLVDGPQTGGERSVIWDGRTDAGNAAANGIYVYRLVGEGYAGSSKLTLAK